jgi:hypothetical protein
MLTPHEFEGVTEGVADRPCIRPGCGRADRDPVHQVPTPRRQIGWVTPSGGLVTLDQGSWCGGPAEGWAPVYVDSGAGATAPEPVAAQPVPEPVRRAWAALLRNILILPPGDTLPALAEAVRRAGYELVPTLQKEPARTLDLAHLADLIEGLAARATRGEDWEEEDDPSWYVDTDRGCLEADEPFEPLVRACDGEVVASCPRREDADLIAMLNPHLVADLVPVLRRAAVRDYAALAMVIEHLGGGCETYTTGIGSCWDSGRVPVLDYTADRWCTACFAQALLEGRPEVASLTSGRV